MCKLRSLLGYFGLLLCLASLAGADTILTSQVPVAPNAQGSSNKERGVAFYSDVPGQITAIRFYKGSRDTGTHVGKLWSASGTLLAQVTFTNETSSGWQQQALSRPISISANTTYVASVNTANYYYAVTEYGFNTQVRSGHLRTVVGNNGRSGSTGAFPTDSWHNSNYFRDVVFVASGSTPAPSPSDSTAPTVSVTSPAAGTVVSGTRTIAASASDNVGVTAVDFIVNGGVVATDTTAPYAIAWDSTKVANGNATISARARDAAGNTKTSTIVTVSVNNATQSLAISGVTSSSITTTGAVISWVTNKASTTQVEYGKTTSYGSLTSVNSTMTTTHQQQLTGLTPGTTYHFRVRSQDASSSQAVSGNYTFTTGSTTNLSCSSTSVRCVGSGQEYSTISSASSAAVAGDTILVMDGTYGGFQITKSGTSSAPITYKASSSNVIISGGGSTGDGIYLARVSYVTVDGFTIRNPSGRCISAREASPTGPMYGLKILNNKCTNSGTEGFYLSQVASSLVQANTINGTGSTGAGRSHGIYLANAGSKNTTLKGNVITGTTRSESAGIHMNGDISIGGDGLITGAVLDGNLIYGGTFNGISADGVQNSTFQNNLIYNQGRNGIRAFRIDGASGPKGLRIINNTIVLTASGWAVKISEDGGGHVIFNNILIGPSNGGALSVGNSNFTSDRNAFSDRLSSNNESSVVSLSTWRSQTGDDANSIVSTASTLFVNPSGGDYKLRSGSPAIDKGAASLGGVAAPTKDMNNVTRPRGAANDLGAIEY